MMNTSLNPCCYFCQLLLLWVLTLPILAQNSEHEKHHPNRGSQKKKGMGMMEGMGDMMKNMGGSQPRELYPSLMSLPELTNEKRKEIEHQANVRMQYGIAMWTKGLDLLSRATTQHQFLKMQEATTMLREGLEQFESGLAAKRALVEGKAPQSIALQWFKKEMNLLPTGSSLSNHVMGMSPFHLTICVLLFFFSAVIIWMYFFKMRRATELLKQIAIAKSLPKSPPDITTLSVEPKSLPKGKQKGVLRVTQVITETPNVKTIRVVDESGGPIPFSYLPGQFITCIFDIDGKKIKRSYTISSSPTQNYFCEFTVKREEQGIASRYLNDKIKEGDTFEFSGPSGKLTFTGTEAESIVLIGGGVGVTPLMSVIRYLLDCGWKKEIFLIFSCRAPDDFIFADELRLLEKRHINLHITVAMSRIDKEIKGVYKGRISKDLIAKFIPNIQSQRVHLCGSRPMADAVKDMLLELGVAKEQIKYESFGSSKKKSSSKTALNNTTATTTVTFQLSGKSGKISPDETILDVADTLDVEIDNSCRDGSCGSCIIKKISGEVVMDNEEGLEPEEKAAGMILACQAKAKDDVVVEA